jgi:uncharacterized membrane protein YkvA (DUF1232 family)
MTAKKSPARASTTSSSASATRAGKATSAKSTAKPKGSANASAARAAKPLTTRKAVAKPDHLGGRVGKVLARSERRASGILKDPEKTEALGQDAAEKADAHRIDLGDAFEDLQTLLRLLHAYAKGDYRVIPAATIVAVAGAVVYFVSPVDAIPDVIPGVGLVDDAAVIYFVIRAIESDLDDFRSWEREQAKRPTARTRKPAAKSSSARKPAAKSSSGRTPAAKSSSARMPAAKSSETRRTPAAKKSTNAAPRSSAKTSAKRPAAALPSKRPTTSPAPGARRAATRKAAPKPAA